MNEKKIFKLEELDQEFWNKVVFVEIEPSSGMGGPGCLWLITSDAKSYFIGFDGFPYEGKLGELHPMLSKASPTSNCDYELENHGFKRYERSLVFVKEEYFQRYKEEYYNVWHKNIGKIHYIHEPDVMAHVLGVDELERFNYEVSVQKWREHQDFIEQCDREREKKNLSEKYFKWLPLYINNIPCSSFGEIGWYCLLLKECDGKIVGHRFTILYQRKELEPLHGYMDAKIEKYILLERKYWDVIGNLRYRTPEEDVDELLEYTFNDNDLNSHGEFIRAFDTMEEAKAYAVAVANRRSYADTENIITGEALENHRLIKESVLRTNKGIKMLKEFAPKLIEFISNYEFPHKGCRGGGYYIPDMVEKLGIDKAELVEMLQYIPISELLPVAQREADDIIKQLE